LSAKAATLWLRVWLAATAVLAWSSPVAPPLLRRALDAAFAPICHQRPERTLILAGHAMCVCSRCAGLYAGIAAGALLAWPTLPRRRHKAVLAVASGLLLTDIVTQDLGLHPVWHATRLATGALVGYASAAWLATELATERVTPANATASLPPAS
jgi:uncharacterized membrane protein